MTPLIQKAVEQQIYANKRGPTTAVDPEDFVWFDLGEAMTNRGKPETTNATPEIVSLPFDRTAFVMLGGAHTEKPDSIIIVYARRVDELGLSITISIPTQGLFVRGGLEISVEDDHFAVPTFTELRDLYHPDRGFFEGAQVLFDGFMWNVLDIYQKFAGPQLCGKCVGVASNLSRIRKGKKPLFEWRTVVIAPKAAPSAPKGGTHASPRHHDRRGHWSVSKLGKRYWRKATKVGNPTNGVVFHDYQLKPATKGTP